MKVALEKIGPDGYDLDVPVTRDWLTAALGPDSPFDAQNGGRLFVHLSRVEDVVHVKGRAQIQLMGECARCLEPLPIALDTPLELTILPKGHEPPAAQSGEVAEEDMGVATYDDDEIDLTSVVRDEVFLELPMSPVCSESCRGLCPSCGINLNQNTCQCQPVRDDRWAALRNIKLNS